MFFISIFHVLSLSRCHQVFGIVSKREMAAHSSHNFPSSIFTSIYRKGASFLPGRQMEKLSQTHFMNRFKLPIKFLLFCSIKLNQFTGFLPFLILYRTVLSSKQYFIEASPYNADKKKWLKRYVSWAEVGIHCIVEQCVLKNIISGQVRIIGGHTLELCKKIYTTTWCV